MGFLSEYESFGLNSDDLRFVWTFDTVAGYIPDTIPSGNGDGTFVAGPNAGFSSVAGQSFWSGDHVKVEGSNGLPAWELFMVFERSGIGRGDVLASTRSTLEGEGFSFGITDTNVPFVYTNLDGEGEMSMFTSLTMSKYNTICFSKGRDSVTLSLYRPSGGYVESETISIKNGVLGNGEVFLGADPFLSGASSPMPNSSFVGTMHECAMSEEGAAKDVRRSLMHNGYSGYALSALVDGLVSSEPLLGCSFMNMLSFEKANRPCSVSQSAGQFYIPERNGLDNARVFADGIEDTAATISSNGEISFSVISPTGGIYDIFITGLGAATPITPAAEFINFATKKQTNSFYGTSDGRRLAKNQEYFEASVLDPFYGKPLGGVSPKSNNILCQKS